MVTLPFSGDTMLRIDFKVVLFPAPFLPISPIMRFGAREKLTIFLNKSGISLMDALDAQYSFHYFFSFPSGVSAIFKAVLNS